MADSGHHETNGGANSGSGTTRTRSKSSEKNFLKTIGSGSPLIGRSSPSMAQISRHASQPHDWNNNRNRSASYPDNSPPNALSPKQAVTHSRTLTSEEMARNKFATMNMSGSASTSSIPAALRTSYGNLLAASNPSPLSMERRNSDTVNNYSLEKKTGCTLSSSRLDFINVPVRLLDDNSSPDTQTITIINNSKDKYFFKVERDPPSAKKYDLNIFPTSGKLGKLDRKNAKNQITISVSLRAFCTTRFFERISIVLIPREKSTLFRRPSNVNLEKEMAAKSSGGRDDGNRFFVKVSIESELSTSIDCDEVEFLGEISSGGWGSVHRAKWREIEIAVKKLHIQELTVEQKEEVLREQNLLKKLACPYVVTYIGSTQVPGQPICLLMEYCKEGSLSKLLKSKRISDRLKVKILLDIAKGMTFLHYNHFYHRDLKPDNVLVVSPHENASISVKITDFDTARYYYTRGARPGAETYETFNNLMSTSSSNLKAEVNNVKSKTTIDSSSPERGLSKGLGTLEYKPPEVIRGEEDYPVDKSDSYSFGMLAWQVWVQRVPYADPPYKDWSPREIEDFVASGKRIECPDNMRPEIKKLILECWDQDPHNRPDFRRITEELQAVWEEMINPKDEDKDGSSVTSLDGWAGDISREEAEQLLLHSQAGTFLIRRSFNVKGYVLSYKSENAILHIRDILPEDGKIKVIKEDHRVLRFDSLKDYINSMKKQKVISHALDMRTYTKTPLGDLEG